MCRVTRWTWPMVGIKWTNSRPGCIDRLRKRLVRCSFLAGKASLALRGCLPMENTDHCVLVNKWVWLRSQICLLWLKVHQGLVLESEFSEGVVC